MTLDELAAVVNEHVAVAKTVPTLEHAIPAGEALIAARTQIGHGEWLAWVAANIDAHMSTVNIYMRIAHHRDVLEAHRMTSYGLARDFLKGWPGPFDAAKPGYGEDVRRAALAMVHSGMTQTAVARMLGVSRAAVRSWIDPAEAERRRVANRRRRAAR
jgi:hypothetical protein